MDVGKLLRWRNRVLTLIVTAFLIPVLRIFFLEGEIQKGPELALVVVLGAFGVVLLLFEGRIRTLLKLKPRVGVEEIPNEPPELHAARQLAAEVRRQWVSEATRRGLLGGPPLMSIGWSIDPDRRPLGLEVDQGQQRRVDGIAELFRKIGPPKTLVVLGEAESGKSAAAVLLTLQLLDHTGAAPVPVLFSLASWDQRMRLSDWLKLRLVEDYPWLRAKAEYGEDAAAELLRGSRIIPVLDGLDELPREIRASVIVAIKDSSLILPGLILTCRVEDYDDVERKAYLAGAVVVRLEGMTPEEATSFLRNAERPRHRTSWDRVFVELESNPTGPLARALSSPLMLALAHRVYEDADRQPEELLAFRERDAVESYLLEAFVPAVFPAIPDPDRVGGRWRGDDARRWLRHLATEMEQRHETDVRWWELSTCGRPGTAILAGIVSAAVGMLAVGSAVGVLFGPLGGIIAGSVVAVALGVACAVNKSPKPSEIQVKLTGNLLSAAMGGLPIALIVMAVGTVVRDGGFGLAAGLIFGLPIGVLYGLTQPDATPREMNPRFLLLRDLSVGLTYGVAYGIPAGFVGWLLSNNIFIAALVGVGCALAGGLVYGPIWMLALRGSKVGLVAFGHLSLAVAWFAPQRKMPWRIMRFLADAQAVGVLRQVGGVYQFRHDSLQKSLARLSGMIRDGRSEPATAAPSDDD